MRNVLPVVVSLCQEEQENIPPPSLPLQTFTPELKCEQDDHKQNIDEYLVSISKQNALVNKEAFPILQQLPSPPQDPTDNTQTIENKPPMTIEEGTKWCQRCGTVETPRWRFGPAGPSTLCNACHLRWKARGKPTEGYSSSVYPPPHHNPSSLKRYKSQTNKDTSKKVKKVKTVKESDQERTITDVDTKPIPVIKPGLCCTNCNTSNTPLWRKGPFGIKTLCNACGLKWAKNNELLTDNKAVTKRSTITTAATCIATMAKRPDNRRPNQMKKIPSSALLHYKKEYIKHGLYYDETRVNAKNKPFAFILPMHQGEFIISKQIDFELPADIHQERELGLIKSLQADRQPAFTRIRSNIFVERKPLSGNDAVVCHCVRPSSDSNKVGCGDDCLNRMLFYECESKYCPCGDLCTNQRFQRKERKKELQVFQTGNRGWGLRTLIDIKKGELVIEYRGEIISHELCEERMCTTYVNEKNFYFLDYCNGEVIDACTKGTEARFINHSCDPNCHIEKWSLKGESHFGVFASKDISAHSELFYDYNFSTFNGTVESQQICYCGSVCCRGTIGKKISSRSRKDV